VKADNKTRCYGDNNPTWTISYSGFKNGDTVSSLADLPTVSTNAQPDSPAGSYSLLVEGGSSANYLFIYEEGMMIIEEVPVVYISSDKGNQLSKGEMANLSASGGTNYIWTNAEGIISGQNTSVLTVRPAQTTTYTVTVTNNAGCAQTASFTVEVIADYVTLKATNIMTPNGDGINDTWQIKDIDMYPNNKVTIFDSSGRVLYTKSGYNNSEGWDGMYNGLALDEGTYYHIIDFGNGDKVIKGYITIIRNR